MNNKRRKEIESIIEEIEDIQNSKQEIIDLISAYNSRFEEVASRIETVKEEEEEYYENMPDSIKEGERGEIASENANNLESALDKINDDVIEKITDFVQFIEDEIDSELEEVTSSLGETL